MGTASRAALVAIAFVTLPSLAIMPFEEARPGKSWVWASARAAEFEDTLNAFAEGLRAYEARDYETALRHWRPLAEQGVAAAQNNLGAMYAQGFAVPQDYTEALRWFRMAAAQGDAEAQASLGVMHSFGYGVPHDDVEAARWFRLAAEQGDGRGQLNLGLMYEDGEGVPPDYVQAHMWLDLAAAGGNGRARQGRDDLAARMTPDQISEARRLALEWMPSPQR